MKAYCERTRTAPGLGLWSTLAIHGSMTDLRRDDDLRKLLAEQARELRGGDGAEGLALADEIMEKAAAYEAVREAADEDPGKAAEILFAALDRLGLEPDARRAALDRLIFGFESATDESSWQTIRSGGGEELYAAARGGESGKSEEELKAELRGVIRRMNFSPASLRRAAKALDGENCTARAAALGREGYALKCVTALRLCRDGAAVDEAVARACAGVDMQALADTVSLGAVWGENASKGLRTILDGAEIALTCFAIDGALKWGADSSKTKVSELFDTVLAWLGPIGVIETWIKPDESDAGGFAKAAGGLSILIAGLLRKGCGAVRAGLRRLADIIARKTADCFVEDAAFFDETEDPVDFVIDEDDEYMKNPIF